MASFDAKNSMGRQLPLFKFDEDSLTKVNNHSVSEASAESDFGKYIVYVDESGDHSLQSIDENYPVFVLAFVYFTNDTIVKLLFQQLRSLSSIISGMIKLFCMSTKYVSGWVCLTSQEIEHNKIDLWKKSQILWGLETLF